jgi:small subunit ribosomal protein S16
MKLMGRKHRPYYRIVAIDGRQPRDGRVIEELGSYDPMIKNTDDRVKLKLDRVDYWTSVGALPSDNVAVLVKKYRKKVQKQATAAAETPAAPTA